MNHRLPLNSEQGQYLPQLAQTIQALDALVAEHGHKIPCLRPRVERLRQCHLALCTLPHPQALMADLQ